MTSKRKTSLRKARRSNLSVESLERRELMTAELCLAPDFVDMANRPLNSPTLNSPTLEGSQLSDRNVQPVSEGFASTKSTLWLADDQRLIAAATPDFTIRADSSLVASNAINTAFCPQCRTKVIPSAGGICPAYGTHVECLAGSSGRLATALC